MAVKIEKKNPSGSQEDIDIPDSLPLLPVRDIVLFPFMAIPLFVAREASIKAVDEALATHRMMLLIAQKDASVDDPGPGDLYEVGTVAMLIRMLKLEDDRVKILVQGVARAKVKDIVKTGPFYNVKIDVIDETAPAKKKEGSNNLKNKAIVRAVRTQLEAVIKLGMQIPPDILLVVENLDAPDRLADIIAAHIGLKVEDAQAALETINPSRRLKKVSNFLGKEIEALSVLAKIQDTAQQEMSKSQRQYYLREQLKAIQKELGDIDEKSEELSEFEEKIETAGMPPKVKEEAEKQLSRLGKMHAESAEATIARTYLEWMVELPWSRATKDNIDIKRARQVLDEDHYDLEKVKERILEYLAVRKLKEKAKGPILCFVGPPGVGKTSLGQSVARALERKFTRISLGGVRDEAEIRGHRRTYIGSLPGRIIQGLKTCGSNNPVFMMDEIDKLGADFRGDPSSALLEVLDPAQNHAFVDHYLGAPFDLTNVMFITTANMVDSIPPALLDRMEVISLAGYTEDEKLHIAKKYIIPRQLDENGIAKKHIRFADKAIRIIIRSYTREAGLRNLERTIANICRKVAKDVASGKKHAHSIKPDTLHKYLGTRVYIPEVEQEHSMVGVATGVAWTMAGGQIMLVEATPMRGGGKLMLTGKLGDVMKESAQAALTYIRSKAKRYGIDEDFAGKTDIHVHVPAGAVPKDGPSAGITIATAILSALSDVPVRKDIAMTGEITLRGRVLPIGGLKEKALSAHRAGIKEMIIPITNEKDLEDIPDHIRKTMTFHLAKSADQAFDWALAKKKKRKKGKK
ncbi:ATP-dependent protease La Type I [hydrothermal vent metagenome]|uniref:ATP-dependent protease La Type I n=1 Tax=hydrothermal vent metagenome TaxID=652676 RepID=A0A3B1CIC4_9ZZZZ